MAAFGVIHRFKDGTAEHYENSLKAVHPDGGKNLPDGQVFHAAGATEDGWVIVAVHESRESWERFRNETLLPALPNVVGGYPNPPEETTFEVHNLQMR